MSEGGSNVKPFRIGTKRRFQESKGLELRHRSSNLINLKMELTIIKKKLWLKNSNTRFFKEQFYKNLRISFPHYSYLAISPLPYSILWN